MDSPVLVILGSSVLQAGLWFAGNILYSVILAGCKKSFGNVISAVSSNILALFASHTQERLRVCESGCHSVFWSTKVPKWKIWGGSWCSVTLSLWSNDVVITYDDIVRRSSRVHPVGRPLRPLPTLTLIVSDSPCLNIFRLPWCNFVLLLRKISFSHSVILKRNHHH